MPSLRVPDVEEVIFRIPGYNLLLMRLDNYLGLVEFYGREHFSVTGENGVFTFSPLGLFSSDRTTLRVTENRRRIPKIKTSALVEPTGVVSSTDIRRFPGFVAVIPTHIKVDCAQVNRVYYPEQ